MVEMVWQNKTLRELIKSDTRVKILLEFGCDTMRFTRWWDDIGIAATRGNISPFMPTQGVQLFQGDLVWANSHHMPFKDRAFNALALVTTFKYNKDPAAVIRGTPLSSKVWHNHGDDEPKHSKIIEKKGTTGHG